MIRQREVYDLGNSVAIVEVDSEGTPSVQVMEWDDGATGYLIYGLQEIAQLGVALNRALELSGDAAQDMAGGH